MTEKRLRCEERLDQTRDGLGLIVMQHVPGVCDELEPAVIEVPAGKRFKLEVANEGKTAIEFESKDLKQEKVVAPGAKTSLSINALKAGEYKFVDEFHESTAKGKIIAR